MPPSRQVHASLMVFAILLPAIAGFLTVVAAGQEPRTLLRDNWALESACRIKAPGEEISKAGFETPEWHKTQVPVTVVGALVTDKTYPDPYFGMNLRSLPGMNFATRRLFVDQPMPEGSPFRCGWWYRTEFTLPQSYGQRTTWLHFDGINYRANVWLNGTKIADAAEIAGAFRVFEFNVAPWAQVGKPNALAVEVFAPEKNDLTINWVDWNPMPPDKNMGLWKDVYLAVDTISECGEAGDQAADLRLAVFADNPHDAAKHYSQAWKQREVSSAALNDCRGLEDPHGLKGDPFRGLPPL